MQVFDYQLIEIIFKLIGGLALFMFAITMLRETLGKLSGARVVKILERVSNDPFKGMAAGTATTFMTQSSSITVLTLIGFVNAGMMTFRQSVNVMLGSEIGTTITAQLVAFDVGFLFWPLIAIGFFMKMFSKNEKVELLGAIIFSLGLIFVSMEFMKEGARPLTIDYPYFHDLINEYGGNALFGILIGALIAGVTQSSSATTSLVIAMGAVGAIDLGPSIALVMGANIGTCFLELFAGIGATTPAKRTAVAQALINVVGVSLFFPFLTPFASLVELTASDLPRQIANAHTIFNLIVSLIFIPLVGLTVRFCERLIPDKEGEIIGKYHFDDQMLHMPQVALREAEKEIIRTAELTLQMMHLSKRALLENGVETASKVIALEDEVDDRCRTTENFIDRIHEDELSDNDVIWRMKLLAILTDVERIGDLSTNIGEFALQRINESIIFSDEAITDLEIMFKGADETYSTAIQALRTRNKDVARQAIELEDEVDKLERKIKESHNKRLKDGLCLAESDTIFIETLRNLERISDHADNIALDVIMKY